MLLLGRSNIGKTFLGISLERCEPIDKYIEKIRIINTTLDLLLYLLQKKKFEEFLENLNSLKRMLKKDFPEYHTLLKSLERIKGLNPKIPTYKKYMELINELLNKFSEKNEIFITLSRDIEVYDTIIVYPGQKFESNPLRDEIEELIKIVKGKVIWSVSVYDLYKGIFDPDDPLPEAFRYYEPRIQRKRSYFVITKVDEIDKKYGYVPPEAKITVLKERKKFEGGDLLKLLEYEVERMNNSYGFNTRISKTLLKYVIRMAGNSIGRIRDFYIISHFSYVLSGKLPGMILETSSFEDPKKFKKRLRGVRGGKFL